MEQVDRENGGGREILSCPGIDPPDMQTCGTAWYRVIRASIARVEDNVHLSATLRDRAGVTFWYKP
jgi:hypothetical protein